MVIASCHTGRAVTFARVSASLRSATTIRFLKPFALLGALVLLGVTYMPPGLSDGLSNPSAAIVRGLYPGYDAGSCCWLADRALLRVQPPPDAASMIVTIFVPDYAPFLADREALTFRIGNGPAQRECCFGPGIHQFPLLLPPHRGRAVLNLTADAAVSFVPARIDKGNDTRRLSVLLRSIEYRNGVGTPIVRTLTGARTSGTSPLALLPFALAFLLCAWAMWRKPAWGLALLIVLEPLGSESSIGFTTLTFFKAALIGSVLGLLLKVKRLELGFDRRAALLLASILCVAGAALLSVLHAVHRPPALRESFKALEYTLVFAVAYAAYRSDPDAPFLRAAFAAIVVIVCGSALVQESTGAPEGIFLAGHAVPRIAGVLEGPNQLAGWMEIVAPVLIASTAATAELLPWIPLAAVAVVTGMLTLSRGGAVGLLCAVIVSSVRTFAQRRAAAAVVAVAALLLIVGVGWRVVGHAMGGPEDPFNGGLSNRADLWRAALAMFRAHPLTGVGAGNYEFVLGRYGLVGVRTHANSWYLQGLAEGGIPMLLALLFVAVATIGSFARSRDAFGIAAFAASIALCVHQIVDDVVFYPKVGDMWWIVLGVAAAACYVADRANIRTADSSNIAPNGMQAASSSNSVI